MRCRTHIRNGFSRCLHTGASLNAILIYRRLLTHGHLGLGAQAHVLVMAVCDNAPAV